jgi:RNA polymerase sigma-70 factor, ECF subfamily
VRVNRAVAECEASGPLRALELLDDVPKDEVDHWHLYWSTRAEILKRGGRVAEARASWERALACSMNDTDRRFIERRLHE